VAHAGALLALVAVAAAGPADARGPRGEAQEEIASRPADVPMLAVVSLASQRISIYDAEGRILRAPISTGRTGYETPAGIYSIIQKNREHYSNLYDDAEMPFMQRITWSGIALHAGALPGYPASHGCIRMPYGFAERLFDLTRMGLRIVVARNDVAPVAISHPLLFQTRPVRAEVASNEPADPMRLGVGSDAPAPPRTGPRTYKSIAADLAAQAEAAARKVEEARRAAAGKSFDAGRLTRLLRAASGAKLRAENQLASAERLLAAAGSPEAVQKAEEAKAQAQAKISEARAHYEALQAEAQPKAEAAAAALAEVKSAEAARAAAAAAAREAIGKIAPVSVFISRETQRLYVRKSFQPVLDTAVTIRDPDKPIGTFVYTAVAEGNEGMRWNVVAVQSAQPGPDPAPAAGRPRRASEVKSEPPATDVVAAKAVLDRIEIPKEALDRITEVVSPGSSLIVSDEAISKETGKGTDFIVVMSGEPQGGIKKRRRPEPWSRYDRSPYGYGGYGGGPFFRW
jgi:hypothetical protein